MGAHGVYQEAEDMTEYTNLIVTIFSITIMGGTFGIVLGRLLQDKRRVPAKGTEYVMI